MIDALFYNSVFNFRFHIESIWILHVILALSPYQCHWKHNIKICIKSRNVLTSCRVSCDVRFFCCEKLFLKYFYSHCVSCVCSLLTYNLFPFLVFYVSPLSSVVLETVAVRCHSTRVLLLSVCCEVCDAIKSPPLPPQPVCYWSRLCLHCALRHHHCSYVSQPKTWHVNLPLNCELNTYAGTTQRRLGPTDRPCEAWLFLESKCQRRRYIMRSMYFSTN